MRNNIDKLIDKPILAVAERAVRKWREAIQMAKAA